MEQEITKIKKILTDVSTGQARIQDCNDEYTILYNQLSEYFQGIGIKNPNIPIRASKIPTNCV